MNQRNTQNQKLGVCMVVSAYYPQGFGGSGQCRSLIQALNNSFSFYVLAASFNPPEDRETEIIDGANVFRIKVWRNQFLNLFLAAPQYLWVFLRISPEIQIVHCHGITSKNCLVILLAKMFGKKVIQKFSSLGFDDPLTLQSNLEAQGFWGKIAKKIFLQCDYFIGLTPVFLEKMKKSFLNGRRFLEIPNGVNLKRFKPAASMLEKERIRERLGIPPGTKVILFVGFFSREKGVKDLFFAWEEIRGKIGPSLLVLVGSTDSQYQEISSELIQEIQKIVQTERLESEVLFQEKADRIEEYYQMADLFVLPSYREGLPNVLLEAMACAMPVLISRLPGVADITVQDGKTGLLFTPGNITELSGRILEVLTDSSLAGSLGDAGRKSVEQHYDIRDIAEKYASLYRSLGS